MPAKAAGSAALRAYTKLANTLFSPSTLWIPRANPPENGLDAISDAVFNTCLCHPRTRSPKGLGESQRVAVASHYPVLMALKLVGRIFVARSCAGTSHQSD